MTPAQEEELLRTIEEAAELARIGRQDSLRSELLSIAAEARQGRRSPSSRLQQLVPLIESLPPELRDIVVQQIDALVSLVNLLERYRNQKPERPKAARRRTPPAP